MADIERADVAPSTSAASGSDNGKPAVLIVGGLGKIQL